ncbi:MAG: hypothetical protein Q9163_004906 [Psora crenata]
MLGGLYILMLSILGSLFMEGVWGTSGIFITEGDIRPLIVGVREKKDLARDDARENLWAGLGPEPRLFEGALADAVDVGLVEDVLDIDEVEDVDEVGREVDDADELAVEELDEGIMHWALLMQFSPAGQQRADFPLLMTIHVSLDGQQKLPGKFAPPHFVNVEFSHVASSRVHVMAVKSRHSDNQRFSYNPKATRRRVHNVPQLTHDEAFTNNGIGRAFTPEAFNIAWHQYQGHLVNRLNEMTAGHPYHTKETKDILQANARNPNQASLFNHASMAWNNHHFFTTLSPDPQPISRHLETRLTTCFSSVESLKKQYLATALSMFGPGFVWLIRNPSSRARTSPTNTGNAANDPEFTILCTYIAGSPLPGAHPRAQSYDMNTENELSMRAGAIGQYSGSVDSKIAPGRIPRAEVCLGVCTWEHCWNHDFGVTGDGKRRYLEAWWDSIDWAVVERNAVLESGKADMARVNLPRTQGGRR